MKIYLLKSLQTKYIHIITVVFTPYYSTNQPNIVDGDAFLKLAIAIASPIVLYRLIPVEYLQLWRGFFAGITLLDREALLLCVKVEAKEQSLEYGAMH